MKDGDWGALLSDLVRQNYAFVASFSVLLWDYLITFPQEIDYVWHCPSRARKCLFFFFRYGTVGYFIVCSIFGTQWTLRVPISRNDCKTWFFIHVASLSLLYVGTQIMLIRKVFSLYGRSTILATALFALHCIQIAGSFILSHYVSGLLNFNPICNGRDVPRIVLSALASVICIQGITLVLILRKFRKVRPWLFLSWRRYLRTFEAHVKMSWGLCLVAILFNSSHAFANRRVAPVYVFTFPVVMISIGGCRYILRFERDRDTRAKLMEAARSTEGKGEQFVGEGQLQGSVLPTQTGYRHSYPPPRQAETHLPRSSLEAFSMRTSESPAGGHSIDMVASNYPYLHGAESYILNRNRSSATTFTNSSIGTNHSPQGSSDCRSRHTASTPLSHAQGSEGRAGSGSVLRAENADSADGEDQNDEAEETQSESNIELGSLQSSSSLNSEELRRFYNGT